jgi:alpha-N-arabinofuranosidase
MKEVDPSIKLIAVGDNDMKWNRRVLELAGPNIDYLAIHHYYGRNEMAGDASNLMARPLFYDRFYKEVSALIREVVPQKEIKLAINEWGLDLPENRQYSMESALYGARLMNIFERNGSLIGMSAVSDLVNGWPGGIIQAGRHGVFVSPLFLVNQLYATYLGTERLAATVKSSVFNSSKEGKDVPVLDASVSRSSDRRKIFIKVINTDPKNSIRTTIRVDGVVVQRRGSMLTVRATIAESFNSFRTPNAISIQTQALNNTQNITVDLARQSVNVIVLNVASQ